jgi:hypothetical protein
VVKGQEHYFLREREKKEKKERVAHDELFL